MSQGLLLQHIALHILERGFLIHTDFKPTLISITSSQYIIYFPHYLNLAIKTRETTKNNSSSEDTNVDCLVAALLAVASPTEDTNPLELGLLHFILSTSLVLVAISIEIQAICKKSLQNIRESFRHTFNLKCEFRTYL
ncbi:hypothetical protein HYC85_011350 [Camellia sinensis]|uniref:Uncharacterized protein n=1 Tax=Camellia sinensis TaxID=4442 RepID=A0A7J7HA07_CAMSI|nr:hypothetical protein HYC85_011350 [Camellia sinensis]